MLSRTPRTDSVQLPSRSPSSSTDDELLAAWIAGDGAAGEVLFHRYYRPLWLFAFTRVRRSTEDAAELANDVFLTVAQNRASIRSFRAYLYGVAKLKVLEHRRARPFEPFVETEAPEAESALHPTALESARERATQEDLAARALRSLPQADQLVLALKSIQRLSMREIGATLGISEARAVYRVTAARRRLRVAVAELRAVNAPAQESRLRRLSSWMDSLGDRLLALPLTKAEVGG